MKRAWLLLPLAALAVAQFGRIGDWSTFGYDIQRTGWERGDFRLTKDSIKDFQLLWKLKLDDAKGPRSLTPPVIIGTLISYRGFKELAFVGGSGNNIYAVNADLGKIFWQRQLNYSSDMPQSRDTTGPCGPALTAQASLVSGFARGGGPGRGGNDAGPGRGGPPPGRGLAGSNGFGASRPVIVIGSDGRIHRLNSANGDDMAQPSNFLPPNSRPSALNVYDNVVYTATTHGCGVAPNAVWAADFNEAEPQIHSFRSNGGGFWGTGGMALLADGTVLAQVGDGAFDPEHDKWSNTTVALNARDLKLKSWFRPSDLNPAAAKNPIANAATPVAFAWHGTEIIAASSKDGRIYLLDAKNPGGADHHTALASSQPLGEIGGGFATWEDSESTRWLLVPVWGASGSITAFKLSEQNGKPVLTQAWTYGNMNSPAPPVIASGMVFALSTAGPHATLYALDASTGKELYSSKTAITSPAAQTGITVANARVYLGTTDGTFYTFGIPMEH